MGYRKARSSYRDIWQAFPGYFAQRFQITLYRTGFTFIVESRQVQSDETSTRSP
jgi:hypothetical protein